MSVVKILCFKTFVPSLGIGFWTNLEPHDREYAARKRIEATAKAPQRRG